MDECETLASARVSGRINGGDGAAVTSAQGVEVNSKKRDGIAAALAVAKAADVVVLALGIDKSVEGEGTDRPDITLPGLQSEFAERVLALRKPTLLILTNGGTLAIDSLVPPTRDAKATSTSIVVEGVLIISSRRFYLVWYQNRTCRAQN